MGPFDIGTINYNSRRIKSEYSKLKQLEQEIINCNISFSNKSGKTKAGRECATNFNKEALKKVLRLKSELKDAFEFLKEKHKTCQSLFSYHHQKFESKKRKRKQNRRKAKKAKLNRYQTNKEKILDLIAPQINIRSEQNLQELKITQADLNFERISKLRKFDACYLISVINENLFSDTGKQTLLEYLPFDLNDTSHNSDSVGYPDDNTEDDNDIEESAQGDSGDNDSDGGGSVTEDSDQESDVSECSSDE